MLKRINNLYLIAIILCSTSLFSIAALGPLAKAAELLGSLIIAALLLIFIVYGEGLKIQHNFTPFIVLIIISLISSMFMAYYTRDQKFIDTIIAQNAIYYYILYFLLHHLKIKPIDIERIFIFFGFLYVVMYLVQFFLYPAKIFDVFILADRGTVRIYLKGSEYLAISYFMCIQAFLRTNKFKYLFMILLFFLIYILLGSRQTMAIMALTLVLFLIFSKKVKSRFFIGVLVTVCVGLVIYMFKDILQALVKQSFFDMRYGSEYIRILAARHFLTEFFRSPLAYITGNGMYGNNSLYGFEVARLGGLGYYLGDIGLLGNYVLYGIFFIIAVIGICYRSLSLKILQNHIYIRYMYVAIIMSLVIGGGFVNADFVCFIACTMYLLDVSHYSLYTNYPLTTFN